MRGVARQVIRAAVRVARISREVNGHAPRPEGLPLGHAPGSNSCHILIVGNGPALGAGVRSHELALPGALARALSARTGTGVEVELLADPQLGLHRIPQALHGRVGGRFDCIVVTAGGDEALDLLPVAEWEARLTAALAELHAWAGPTTSIIVTGVSAGLAGRGLGLPGGLARVVEHHATELDRASRAACAAWSRTAFVPLASADTGGDVGPADEYARWAAQIAATMISDSLLDGAGSDEVVDEVRRQSAVDRSGLSDSGTDARMRHIVEMARRAFGTDTALFTVIDRNIQLHVARAGMDATRMPRAHSFCQFTILDRDGMIVEDARNDERFRDIPQVVGEPHVRFYAGFPVNSPDGERLGALCVFDPSPRRRDDVNMSLLRELAHLLQEELWRSRPDLAARR